MRTDSIGLFWQDNDTQAKERRYGPIPPWPSTGWRPPAEFPNIRNAKAISLDTETYDPELDKFGPGWGRGKSHIIGVSLAVDGGKWYFPVKHEVEKELNLDYNNVMEYLRWALGGPGVKIGANLMYDIGNLECENVFVSGKLYDVQIAQSLIYEQSRFSLENLGQMYLGKGKATEHVETWARDYYKTSEKKWRKDLYRCPTSLVGPYAEDDAAMPMDILLNQWPLLVSNGLMPLFEMECGLIRLLIKMRMQGVNIDMDRADQLRDTLSTKENELQKQLDELIGFKISVNSGNDLAKAFDKFKLKYNKTAEGNPSFTKDFLSGQTHQLPKLVTSIRDTIKLRSTFVEGYLLNSSVNGRVHGQFHLTKSELGGARTGRLASSHPNLQNIPIRSATGKLLRECFIPNTDGIAWRKYDLSQIEYRFLAHFAAGPFAESLQQRYIDDPTTDFHELTSLLIKEKTGIALGRSETKSINFGLVYGMGINHLADQLNLSVGKAKELLESYHEGAPFAKDTMDSISDEVHSTGMVKTIMGRISHFDLWESSDFRDKSLPRTYEAAKDKWGIYNITRAYIYRSINYKLQGSAADQMKKAMLIAFEAGVFDVIGVPLLTIHDELDHNDTGDCAEAFDELQNIMQTSIPLKIPVICDYEIGDSWGTVQEPSKLTDEQRQRYRIN